MPLKESVTSLLGKRLTGTEVEIEKYYSGGVHGTVAKIGVPYSLERVHSRFESPWAAEI